jgi:hypothetical protein
VPGGISSAREQGATMPDFILVDGDFATFLPPFGAAMVVPLPGILQGTGLATFNGRKLCVDGDEKKVSVPGCAYISGPYVIPGIGTLKIDSLAVNQKAIKTHTGGKPVLLKGLLFTAKFEVMVKAMQPPQPPVPPLPDPMSQYSGQGMFIPTNTKFLGT